MSDERLDGGKRLLALNEAEAYETGLIWEWQRAPSPDEAVTIIAAELLEYEFGVTERDGDGNEVGVEWVEVKNEMAEPMARAILAALSDREAQ